MNIWNVIVKYIPILLSCVPGVEDQCPQLNRYYVQINFVDNVSRS